MGIVSDDIVGATLVVALGRDQPCPYVNMRPGLVIYGSLDTVSGGYLYDRMLVAHLRQCGDEVDIISIPWRNYGQHLADNFSSTLLRRLRDGRYDVLLQDELNHPSLFLVNRIIGATRRSPLRTPIFSIVHHLRSGEHRPAWKNTLYRFVERQYLSSVDGFIFNSRTTKDAVERLAGDHRPSIVAYPAGDHFSPPLEPGRIRERATRPGPLRLLFVGNIIPRKGLHTLLDALAQIRDGWELNVVGSAEVDRGYVTEVQRRIANLGLLPSPLPSPQGGEGVRPESPLSLRGRG
ncbi:MAG: glycosyltransferase, partial [Chloroflexota bacterium]